MRKFSHLSATTGRFGRPGHIGLSFWFVLVALLTIATALVPFLSGPPTPPAGQLAPTAANVWHLLEREAPAYGLDPRFVYALVQAESRFDPYAFNLGARGLFQIRPDAWYDMSEEPFREAWNWEKNTRTALKYLAWCRDYLNRHQAFSLPLLAACYHYGVGEVSDADFQIKNLPRPKNAIYRELFAGNAAPIKPPAG
jgi:soluble lytic murein transglycosylase-like protein